MANVLGDAVFLIKEPLGRHRGWDNHTCRACHIYNIRRWQGRWLVGSGTESQSHVPSYGSHMVWQWCHRRPRNLIGLLNGHSRFGPLLRCGTGLIEAFLASICSVVLYIAACIPRVDLLVRIGWRACVHERGLNKRIRVRAWTKVIAGSESRGDGMKETVQVGLQPNMISSRHASFCF